MDSGEVIMVNQATFETLSREVRALKEQSERLLAAEREVGGGPRVAEHHVRAPVHDLTDLTDLAEQQRALG